MAHQLFDIPTRDGRARLKGQIDWPESGTAPFSVVVIIPGGWFMERDGYMGGTGTERDLIYRDFAMKIVARGIAVVRYDNRGVHGNEKTMPPCRGGSNEIESMKHYLDTCINADIRQTVTVQTQMDDVEDIWEFTIGHPGIDSTRAVIWAHSEGGVNVGRLIGAGRISPKGVICVGTVTEDPVGLVRWQTVDRYAAHLMCWDTDGDGRVTKHDIEVNYCNDQLFPATGIGLEVLTPPPEGWNYNGILELFEEEYERMKTEALEKSDHVPYPGVTPEFRFVNASNNWWKQWFLDTVPIIDHFTSFAGYSSFHFGEIDSQNPGEREFVFAKQRISTGNFVNPPQLVFHSQRGHALRTGAPAEGPMDYGAQESLVNEIEQLFSGT